MVFDTSEVPAATAGKRAGAFQRPGDEFEAVVFRRFGVVRWHQFAALVFHQHRHRRREVVQPGFSPFRHFFDARGGIQGFIEEDGLFGEFAAVFQPVADDFRLEGLRVNVAGGDAGGGVVVQHFLRVVFEGEAVKRHRHDRLFQFRRHFHAELFEQLDAFFVRHQFAVLCVEVGAPVGRAVHVFLHRARFFVAAVHFAFQAFEFGKGDVGGAAFDFGFFYQFAVGIEFCRFERHAAFGGKRRGEDVGGVVQVVLCVAADEFFVFGEGNVAFEDARTFTRAGEVGIAGVFREHQRRAPVANGKFGFFRRLLRTGEQLLFEGAVFEVVDEVKGADTVGQRLLLGVRAGSEGGKDGEGQGAFHGFSRV